MNADPALRERLTRAADHIALDVERRLGHVMAGQARRATRTRTIALIVAGLVALIAIGVGWLTLPRKATPQPQATQPPQTEPVGFLITSNDGTGEWPPEVTALPADGGPGIRVFVPNPDISSDWDWSPDHTRVVVMEQIAVGEPEQRLVVSRLDGPQPVSMGESQVPDPLEIGEVSSFNAYFGRAWSADSRRFAFASGAADGTTLTVVDVTTGTVAVIARWDHTVQVAVDWSPDASRLVVAVPDEGIFTMASDGSDVRQVSDVRAYRISWSPVGSTLAAEVQGPDDETPGIWLMGSDGTDPHRVSPVEAADLWPLWSPDGAWIAFSRDTSPAEPKSQPQLGTTVFLMRPDGSDLRRMLPTPEDGWNEVWDWLPSWPPADQPAS